MLIRPRRFWIKHIEVAKAVLDDITATSFDLLLGLSLGRGN